MSPAGKASPAEIEITKDLTLPKLLLWTARRYGDRKVAMREKEFGIWRPITWKEYLDNVKYLALGFTALGMERGDKVAMIGDNRPEGLWAEMATMCVGSIGVWLFQDCLIDEVQYIIDHSDAKFLVGEGQEEVDKALSIKDKCPELERVIWDDPKGMRDYDDPILISLKEVQRLGREMEKREPGLFEDMVEKGDGDDICLLFYTSGTTALPKGALLTHYNMLKMGQNLMRVDPCYESDDFVSFLPFAWIGEQMMSISCGLQAGFSINFPEEPETVLENLREIGPRVMFSSARLYEQMVRTVQVKYLDASFTKRKTYEMAMNIGYRLADMKFAKKKIPWWWKGLGYLAHITVWKKLRDHLGLSRIRNAYTGGSAIGPDHFRYFHAIGVNLKQIYGQTEIAGISVLHRSDDIKFDTVGKPIPETEVRITPDGEIISRSPSVFKGYYKMPEETARTLRDSWLYSGDTGFIDEDGHLVFFDRTKDIIVLSDGSRFSPMYLESRLKFSPFIKDAWVIGDKKPYVAAVICIDYGVVGKWAEDRGIPYTSYPELSQEPRVYGLVEKVVRQVNKGLPKAARIRKFINLYKEFDADDDELTRTRKIRRGFIEERYRDIVEGLYTQADKVHMDTTITYENGRVSRIRTDLRIAEVPLEEEA
ncbi:MAG: AMP-binding protein [candidate division NC10 bacterium]|nr:AMP-binding protein [candidate division NC10 bacterium]